MNLLSYNSMKSPSANYFFLMWRSCHAFYRSFTTRWWKPTIKWSSSSWTNYSMHYSNASVSSIPVVIAMRKLGTMYSMGMTASFPYTSLNGVCPVSLLQVVWYAHNTTGIFKSQSSCLALHTFVNTISNILLNASTFPFAYGWYGVLFLCCTCNSYVSAFTVRYLMHGIPSSIMSTRKSCMCVFQNMALFMRYNTSS